MRREIAMVVQKISHKIRKGVSKVKLVLTCMIVLLVASSSLAVNKFYNDRERGWYYHECLNCDESIKHNEAKKSEILKQSNTSIREMDGSQVLELLEGVQKEMQVRQARYTLEPSVENARDFLHYQQLMFKNGAQASKAMQTVLIKYPYLDSRIENPISQQAIRIKTVETLDANNLKIKEFAQHFKLLYFFKEGCPYCLEFQPVLERIAKVYSFKVEAISSDGTKLKGFSTRFDKNLVTKLNITTYPTIIAYNSQNNIYLPISRGFLPEEDLKLNILHVYQHIVKLSMEVK